jgi:hypothetical protein
MESFRCLYREYLSSSLTIFSIMPSSVITAPTHFNYDSLRIYSIPTLINHFPTLIGYVSFVIAQLKLMTISPLLSISIIHIILIRLPVHLQVSHMPSVSELQIRMFIFNYIVFKSYLDLSTSLSQY